MIRGPGGWQAGDGPEQGVGNNRNAVPSSIGAQYGSFSGQKKHRRIESGADGKAESRRQAGYGSQDGSEKKCDQSHRRTAEPEVEPGQNRNWECIDGERSGDQSAGDNSMGLVGPWSHRKRTGCAEFKGDCGCLSLNSAAHQRSLRKIGSA